MRATEAVGRYGESVAAAYLQAQGYAVVARNWRCDHGEVDLVAHDGSTTVICEVKTRRSRTHGTPQEAVTAVKVERLRRLAWCWMEYARTHGLTPRDLNPNLPPPNPMTPVLRLDVVAVWLPGRGPAHAEHVKAVGS